MKKRLHVCATVLLFAILTCALSVFTATASDLPEFTVTGAIPDVVVRGGAIDMPKATATKDGVTKTAIVSIYDPAGKLAATGGESFIPTATGEYTVRYRVNFDKTYTQDATFTVVAQTSGVFRGDDTITVTPQTHTDSALFKTDFEGVLLTATKSGATATFTQPIDLSYNTKDDPLLSLLVIPSAKGTLDFDQFTVTLTDAHDADNAVRIVNYRGSWGYNTSYVRAAANKQQLTGYEGDKPLMAYNTGSPIWFSFTAEPSSANSTGDKLLCTYRYDNDERAVYVDNEKRSLHSSRPGLVTDFDSLDCQNAKLLWDGFTTGEAYLSITFESLLTEQAKILVTQVNGIRLSGEMIEDTTGPVIRVDMGEYATAPDGLAGTPYPVFPATAYDRVDGAVTPSVSVYKAYGTQNQQLIASRVGRSFTTGTAGEYSIVYAARDNSNNPTEKAIPVRIAATLPDMTATYSSVLPATAYVGESVRLPDVTVDGGSGNKTVDTYVLCPDGSRATGRSFTPQAAGIYRFTVEATDYIGRTFTDTQTITVAVPDAPIIRMPSVRKVFLNGYGYTLPQATATDVKNGGGAVTPTVSVQYGDGTPEPVSGTFTPDITKGDRITVIYTAVGATGTATNSVTATVVDGGIPRAVKAENYFLHDGFTVGYKTNGLAFVTEEPGDKTLPFANPLLANNLRLGFSVDPTANAYESLAVTLTDAEDEDVSLTLRIYRGTDGTATKSRMTIGSDKSDYEVSSSFFGLTTYGFDIGYNNASCSVVDYSGNRTVGAVTDPGFTGFPSGKVYLTIAVEGATGKAGVTVGSVGNQTFAYAAGETTLNDRTSAQLGLQDTIRRSATFGQPYAVPAAIAADVLNPNASVTLTVVAPDGSQIYKGAIDTAYTFTPDQYGAYKIQYERTAGSRSETTPYTVTVKDTVPPTLTVNGAVPTTARRGDAISLPNATVTDNRDTDLTYYILICDPRGTMYTLQSGATYAYAGVYQVTYYCCDADNAYTAQSFTVTVA